MAFNTIATPFTSPVIDLSASGAKARLVGNIVACGGARQAGQKLAAVRSGAAMQNISGESNWFCGDFSAAQNGPDRRFQSFRASIGRPVLRRPRRRLSPPPRSRAANGGRASSSAARFARSARHGGGSRPAAACVAISSSGRRRETDRGRQGYRRGAGAVNYGLGFLAHHYST